MTNLFTDNELEVLEQAGRILAVKKLSIRKQLLRIDARSTEAQTLREQYYKLYVCLDHYPNWRSTK